MKRAEFFSKNKLQEYDRVEISTKAGTFVGDIIPAASEHGENIVMKLSTGYNASFSPDEINAVKKMHRENREPKTNVIKYNPKLPEIAILHTGGTIASRVNYATGGVIASFSAEDLMIMFPELEKTANYRCELISNMMSEDIRFSDYAKMARAIEKYQREGKVKGIVIGHGTDTLAYTAAALSFMLEGLNIPVILVGAQRSSDRGSSDAASNLKCAVNFIANTDFVGVALCMHESINDLNCAILPATKTRKLHTSRRDAFKPVNDTAIARVEYPSGKVTLIKKDYARKSGNAKLVLREKFDEKVGIVRTYPNMQPEIFEFFAKEKFNGLVLETTGIGQAPINTEENEKNLIALKKLVDSGCIVVATSQCIFGRVHKDIYTNCRRLSEIGVIFAEDMISETAYIKLAWLLGNYKKEEAKKLFLQNLCGEISERSPINGFEI